ncbi:hypothetical protein PFLUV_G00054370 [Perca fluviatilis]|uniref:Uncharacterized protein n=1 Tax=Perca fluviatilis TaxID=8168 RepID=A0A6A5F5G4_PERFL|nr:hypothetical protein PFLUV_G00054370 [Perca fluviatilis]
MDLVQMPHTSQVPRHTPHILDSAAYSSAMRIRLIAYTGQRREGMECQYSRQDATFPRDIFKYCCREKDLKASLEAPFETFQLSVKSLRANTLISKRSSGSPAVGSALASGASFPAPCTPFHLTTV